jgi:hypothetical protein
MPAGRGGRGRMPSQHPHAVWPMPGAVTIRPALAPSAPGRPESSDQARCVPSGPAKSGRPVKGPASIVRPSLAMRSGAGDNLPTKSGDVRSGRPARIVRPKLAAWSRRTSRQVPALIAPDRQVVQSGVAALTRPSPMEGRMWAPVHAIVGVPAPAADGGADSQGRMGHRSRTGCRSKVMQGQRLRAAGGGPRTRRSTSRSTPGPSAPARHVVRSRIAA